MAKEMIQVVADAAESLLYEGLDKTMNQYNSSERIES
jgi:biotin synthase-related radical SAM superfamily protein